MPPTVPPLPATVSSAAAGVGSEIVGNRKRSRGRCKIPMAKIDVKRKNHVTFSKRRKGLFKKASELYVLTGAEIAIVTFSGAGKAFTFGHPSAHAVIERYLLHLQGYNYASASSISNNSHDQLAAANSAEGYDQYWLEEMKVAAAGGSTAGHGNYVDDDGSGVSIGGGGGGGEGYWWDQRVDDLSLNELESYMAALQGLRDTIITKTSEEDGNVNLFGSRDASPLSSSYSSLRGSGAAAGAFGHDIVEDDSGGFVLVGQADPRPCSAALCNGCRWKHYEQDRSRAESCMPASDPSGLYWHGI
ncbi:hypothetical protein Dimus_033193 [Dionaea muscipula]